MLNTNRRSVPYALVLSLLLGVAGASNAAAQRASGLGFGLPSPADNIGGNVGTIADFGPGVSGAFRQLVADPTTWQRWWSLHREEFLDLDASAPQGDRLGSETSPEPSGAPIDAAVLDRDVLPKLEALFTESGASADLRATGLLAAARLSMVTGDLSSAERIARQDRLEDLLQEALRSHSPILHESAIYGLGLVGSHSTLSLLGELAHDRPQGREFLRGESVPLRSRAVAAYALGLAGYHAKRPSLRSFAAHQLEALLDDEGAANADLGTAVVLSLGLASGDRAEPQDQAALGVLQIDGLIERLVARWDSDEVARAVAERIPTTLGRLAPLASTAVQERTVVTLLDALEERSGASAPVRRAVVLALGQIGYAGSDEQDVHIRRALIDSLDSRDALLRRYSALSLARVGSRTQEGRADRDAGARSVARALLAHLKSGRSADRPWSALALGVFAHYAQANRVPLHGVDDGLVAALRRTRSSDQRPALALAAGLAGAPGARMRIERSLERIDGDESKGLLALSLGLLGTRESLPLLRDLAKDSHSRPELRVDLAMARSMLGDSQLVPELLEQVEQCDCWSSTLGSTRALARVGDAQALALLLAMVQDKSASDRERALAAQSLGWMASGEGAPWSTPLTLGLDPLGAPDTLTEPSGTGVLDRL